MYLLIDNKIWELVELYINQVLIDCKWVYKLKDSSSGEVKRIFKAKLFTRDFIQEKDVDYKKKISRKRSSKVCYNLFDMYTSCNIWSCSK